MSIRRTITAASATLALLGTGAAFASAPALAVFGSQGSFGKVGPVGGLLEEPHGVAVESSSGDVFVMDVGDGRVVKYNPEGTQVLGEFTGAETPQTEFKAPGFGNGAAVVVDNSTAGTKGDVYVTSGTVVDRFKPKGSSGNEPNEYEYECQMAGVAFGCTSAENPESGAVHSVAVDSSGDVYYGKLHSLLELEAVGSAVAELHEFGASTVEGVAVAGTDVYVAVSNGAGEPGERELVKFELNAARNKVEHEEAIGVNGDEHAVAVDPAGDVYVLDEEGAGQSHVAVYEPNPISLSTASEEFGTGEIGEAWGIAYSGQGNGRIYVTEKTNDAVHVFEQKVGGHPPELERCTAVTPTPVSAKVACTIKPNAAEASWKLEYRTGAGTFTKVTGGSVTSEGNVEGEITGLRANTKYEWRMTASNSGGKAHQEGPFLTPPAVDGIEPCAGGGVEGESATLGGSTLETIGGVEAKWRFEYGLTAGYGLATPEQSSTSFPALVEAPVAGLEPNAEYHCRLVASDKYGTTEGQDGTFKTLAVPPLASGEPASFIAAHAATLVASVDPENSATTFHFEYGQSEAYGQQTLEEAAGSGLSEGYVHQRIEDLAVRTAYHFRVVATNEQAITVYGPDETFTTGAEGIPAVQTGSASDVSQTGASISGTADPEGIQTSYAFEVGTDTSYSGAKIYGDAGNGEGAEPITVAVQGLAPATTYHYRLTATNAYGTTIGEDMTFTTPGIPSPIVQPLVVPLLVTPSIAFPTETGTTTSPATTKALTRAQKLAAALKTCRTKSKGKRARCERRVRKQYAPAKAEAKKKHNKQHQMSLRRLNIHES